MGNEKLEEDLGKAKQTLNDDQVKVDKKDEAVKEEDLKDSKEKTQADQKKANSD